MEETMPLETEAPPREMPERVRAFDWATTELGAIATWPPCLAALVDVVTAAAWPMLLWWGDRAIQIYNDAARDLLGDEHPRALGAPAAEVWRAAWRDLGPAVARVRGGHGVVVDRLALDHGRTWSFALSPVPDGAGGVGGVLVIARDTTATASFIEVYREYLRALFMDAPAPIVILRGPLHVIEVVNSSMAGFFARTPEDVLGRPAFEAVPELRPLFEPVLAHILASGESRVIKELQYRTEHAPDGTTIGHYANVLFAPLRDLHGAIEGVLIIAVEITDEIRARDEMQRLRGVAETANRAKDEFLAILGHELRNPLSPISTALQLMRLRGMTGRELDVIERQVGHLTRLVDDLLDVSRAIRGKIELHCRELELAGLVAEAVEMSSPLLEERRQAVDVEVPRHGLVVQADRERMVQVILNLITNAAKYSDPGSRIAIRGSRTDDTIRLSVCDRGAGIAPEMLGRVFDPFVQQPQTIDRARGGLGLGLSIVRSLVELHGGRVSAASEGVDRGSEFTIELPASVPIARPAPGPGPAGAGERPAKPGGKILVVDDNEDAATMLRDALEQLGYQVAVAHDGPSALRVAPGFAPDIALLDLGLPIMDGFELAERLHQQPMRCPHLVAVTGYGQDSDRQRSKRAGFERHLVKPIAIGELSRVVAELVA